MLTYARSMRWKEKAFVSFSVSDDPPPPGSHSEHESRMFFEKRVHYFCAFIRLLIDRLNDLDDAHVVVAAGESIMRYLPTLPQRTSAGERIRE